MKYIENNKMYIQLCDLYFIFMHGAGVTPKSVFDKVLNIAVNMTDDNKFDFIEFDDPNEVNYFKKLTFILDYGIMKLSSDDVYEYVIDAQDRLQKIGLLFKKPHNCIELADLKCRYDKARYRYDTAQSVYDYKRTIEKQKELIKVKSLKPSTLNTRNNNV